jgi:hypothetical protein
MLAMSAMRRMGPSYDPSAGAASARDIVRALRASGAAPAATAPPLELRPAGETPPHLEQATPLEGEQVRVRAVPDDPVVGFGAFLDGIQRSEVLAHHGPCPLVHGAVAAAVRVRRQRRMRTWGTPTVSHACYAPVAALESAFLDALRAQCPVVDTLGARGDDDGVVPQHPGELTARALTAVQRARERAERDLAEAWTRDGDSPLLIDGGIAASAVVAKHALAVGVVKSHRTLYVSGDSLEATFALRAGERTTAVALTSPRRTTVATWYLRLRDPGARGPLFGLVRVEVAAADPGALGARADLVSRWLLAERTPVALPDARWDVMVHGIRDCEEYLSAILR